MSYIDILRMPVNRLDEYITWKLKFDHDKEKAKSDSLERLKI